MAPVRITSISFDHHRTGFGIGHSEPRLSWRFDADHDTKNWVQESYDIEVGSGDGDDSQIFRVHSSHSVLVPWPAAPLGSRDSAWIKVRSHGRATGGSRRVSDVSTDWSSPAKVEAALLTRDQWTAKLVSSTLKAEQNEPIPPQLLRHTFTLSASHGQLRKARLYITAHGIYEAFINGKRVGDEQMAPGWTSYHHRLLYQTFDVTSLLDAGKSNVIGVELGEGWYAGRLGWEGRRHIYGDRLGLLAQLEIEWSEGSSQTIQSDGSWKWSKSATTRSEIYDGEDYDAGREQPGWNSDSNFDERSWMTVEELEIPRAELIASDAPPVRVVERVLPIEIFRSPSGKVLVDFGQNLVGKLEVRLPATKVDSQKVSFSHAEVLEHGELGTRPLRTAKPIDTVTLYPEQPSVWSPKFTFHGFRYVQVGGWPIDDGMPGKDDLTALVMFSDMERTGYFSCSEPMVNQLHENVVWGMKGNFLSVPTDCPQRDERLGWTGDLQVFAPSASFLFNTQGFLGNWLQDLSAEQLQEGTMGLPGLVIPDIIKESPFPSGQAVWHDVTVLTPRVLYDFSGDMDVLRKQYRSMKAWVDEGISVGPNGLWDQQIWQLADWLDPAAAPEEAGNGRTDGVLVADTYLVHVLETISQISALLNEKKDAEHYRQRASSARKAFEHEYIAPSGLLVGDTQAALALALSFGLFQEQDQIKKAAGRLAHLVHFNRYRIATGFAGTPVITHALTETGNHQLAYKMLLEKQCPSWLYPITMGATTIWERWDSMLPDGTINPGSMTSFNHYALGAVANWLHKSVAGISPLTPGWRQVLVKPIPGGTITSASASHDGPYGRVECSWKLSDDQTRFDMNVSIPPNCKAKVVLPNSDESRSSQLENNLCVGSGKHTFSCAFKPAEWPPKPALRRSTFGHDPSE